ncbi:rubredoxin [Mucilaginibacter ginsenosidivorax]|uniref:Rubredoxin n=1 Tax=Mucilaginibacter ginsenosidivorax TaxID=862126 RepID=A0A5B8W118_9SPHI|nr:rubredoxin [Mucilaginibacter ginsenosidivorax]QEC77507.1 rubredoxin [Mucilaginibacter ginsenosidivorax]
MKKKQLIKINLPGGVASAGDFYEMLIIAQNAGAAQIRFGNRQQLYFEVDAGQLEDLEFDMLGAGIDHEINADQFPNITSSYIADGIFNHENWLKEGVYKDIFDLFDYQPELKINLVDSNQTFAPFFTGNFNFISSPVSNYWYLYIRFPKTNILYCWPVLVYSDDIPALCKAVQQVIFANKSLFYDQAEVNAGLLYQLVATNNQFVIQQIDQPLNIPEFQLPYYEGFNKQGNKYWLGIYRRNELFDIEFLKDICNLCMQTRVGQLYISPWKSLLVKNIEAKHRPLWGNLLNKYRVNIRHASNELNWQVEDLCSQCLDLKQQLVREFEEADLRTYRLSFAIKRSPKSGIYGSIMIRERKPDEFEIVHTRDFNHNTREFVVYKQGVAKTDLGRHLIALCDLFYEQQSNINQSTPVAGREDMHKASHQKTVHQCKNCFTIYDEAYGDELNGLLPGISFSDISSFECPTCGAGKEDYQELVCMA